MPVFGTGLAAGDGGVEEGEAGLRRDLGHVEGDGALAFVRGTPGEAPQRIGYRLNTGRVELLYWPQLDAPAAVATSAYPVAEGVESWRISLANGSGHWVERWGETGPQPDDAQLPRGARIELTLLDGTQVERVLALQ